MLTHGKGIRTQDLQFCQNYVDGRLTIYHDYEV